MQKVYIKEDQNLPVRRAAGRHYWGQPESENGMFKPESWW